MTITPIVLSDFGCHNSRGFRMIVAKDDLMIIMTAGSIVVQKSALIIIPTAIATPRSITYFLKKKSMEVCHSA